MHSRIEYYYRLDEWRAGWEELAVQDASQTSTTIMLSEFASKNKKDWLIDWL